jgi:hypothetical protein
MALKNIWTDKTDGVDDVLAKDINDIAHGVIELEDKIGDIENAFDELHDYAQSIVSGGDSV